MGGERICPEKDVFFFTLPLHHPHFMKSFAVVLLSVVLTGCASSPPHDDTFESGTDSLVVPTASTPDVAIDEGEDFSPSDSLASSIQGEVEALEKEVKSKTYLTLHAHYLGYEADSDATWYFDSLLNIIFCDITWSMEGTSGSFTYYFEGDDILAGSETNSYNDYEELVWVNKHFKPAFGFSRTDGADTDDQINYLVKADYESKNSSVKNDYQKLLSRIREYEDSATETGDEISITIENVVSYGNDFTEKEEFTISKIIFDELIKD
jgi:hypothetical protein